MVFLRFSMVDSLYESAVRTLASLGRQRLYGYMEKETENEKVKVRDERGRRRVCLYQNVSERESGENIVWEGETRMAWQEGQWMSLEMTFLPDIRIACWTLADSIPLQRRLTVFIVYLEERSFRRTEISSTFEEYAKSATRELGSANSSTDVSVSW